MNFQKVMDFYFILKILNSNNEFKIEKFDKNIFLYFIETLQIRKKQELKIDSIIQVPK